MSKEDRKEITGFPGYFINKKGQIASMRKQTLQLLKINDRGGGNSYVRMTDRGFSKRRYVYRLVAEHYIPNPEGHKYLLHKDQNKTNNSVENLERCSYDKDLEYSRRDGSKWRESMSHLWKDMDHRMMISNLRSDSAKRMWKDEAYREKMKIVIQKNIDNGNFGTGREPKEIYQYTMDGVFVGKYKSAREAADANGIPYHAGVSDFCRNPNKYKHHKGYKWSYTQCG